VGKFGKLGKETLKMKKANLKLNRWAKELGYRVVTGDPRLLNEVGEVLERRKNNGEIDQRFFEENLSLFDGLPDRRIGPRETLILVAVPRPAHILTFETETRPIELLLPPTYHSYRPLFEEVRKNLMENVFEKTARLKMIIIPLKSLAVRLGLATYGRNNLTYIPGFGSYYQLVGYIVDKVLPYSSPAAGRLEIAAEACRRCLACRKACPRRAIGEDRFLLHAEKCYTLDSESSRPFPAGTLSPSPHCIIGCLKCQEVCPMNKNRMIYEKAGVSLSKEETESILESDDRNSFSGSSISSKFAALGLSESTAILLRNFRYLVNVQKSTRICPPRLNRSHR
jgi:epoxyqueuosine reductase